MATNTSHDWRIGFYERLIAETSDQHAADHLRADLAGLRSDPGDWRPLWVETGTNCPRCGRS